MSRYRLQPHHIRRYVDRGDHDPENLATSCWFHHHIAIHRQGFRIDPDSLPHRRRLIQSAANTDPPALTDRPAPTQPHLPNCHPGTHKTRDRPRTIAASAHLDRMV